MYFAHQDSHSGLLTLKQSLQNIFLFSLVPFIGFTVNGVLPVLVPFNAINGLLYGRPAYPYQYATLLPCQEDLHRILQLPAY